jgi:hypothetical protein
VDPARVSTDFNADFSVVPAPDGGTVLAAVGATLGTAGATTRWRVPNIILSGNQSLTIQGNTTVVVLAGSGVPAISVTGNAAINVAAGAKAVFYAEGDVKIAGNGLANANIEPVTFQLWGTNTGTLGQAIDIAGNGALRAVIYAPNGDVKINGNGAVMGSVVARSIVLVGNAAFHYDEALANFGGNAPFGIAKWRELTSAADRAAYLGVFAGW